MYKILIKLLAAGTVVRLLHSLNISWYGSRMTFLMTDQFAVETFDSILFGIVIIFLLFMIWKRVELKGKYHTAYIILKVSFHVLIIGYIIYEGFHTCTFDRMCINLLIYGLLELVLLILHFIAHKPKKNKEPPTSLLPNE